MYKKLMFSICVFSILCSTVEAIGQDFYGFKEILKGPTVTRGKKFKPGRLEADLNGGIILFTMSDTAEKTHGDYEFRWQFIDNISRIEKGKKYRFEIVGRRIGGSSEKNTNTAWMKSSNQGSVLAKTAGIESTANVLTVLKSQANVVAWPIKKNNKATGTVELATDPERDTTYFSFQFDFSSFPYASNSRSCSFEVVYVFEKNLEPKTDGEESKSDTSVVESFQTDDGLVFSFARNGDRLTGTCVAHRMATTKIDATLFSKTQLGQSGSLVEILGFKGTFETKFDDGRSIRGTTTVFPTNVPGEIEISSTYDQDGKTVSGKAKATRISIFEK